MATSLTAASVERLKPDSGRRLELPDALLPGLYLVIQPSGVKGWAVRYRHAGKPRKMTLGSYPKVDLGKARELGRVALHTVALGRDPGSEKIEARRKAAEADADQDLVSGAFDSFLTRHVKANTNARSARGTEHLFRLHVLPHWKDRRLDEIRHHDVIELLDRVIDRGSPVAANRVLAAVRKFMNWSVDRGLIEVSPCARVKAPTEETSRDRVLSDYELQLVWLAADEVGAPFGPLVRTLMLTAQRRDEVGQMTRAEIDEGRALWTIPASRAKNGRANDVPLNAATKLALASAPKIAGPAGFIFTTSGASPFSGYSKCKARLDAAMLAIARKEAEERGDDPEIVTLQPWRLHDLRRTAASGMARHGVAVHVIEACLNHISGTISGVAAVYNRHKYLDEKRAALEAWGRFVMELVEDRMTGRR